MKAQELREKTLEELQDDLIALYKDQFNYRMQNSRVNWDRFIL